MLAIKRRHIGEGCWNGYGGGIDPGETVEEAAIRELQEETGGVIGNPEDLKRFAKLIIENHKTDGSVFVITVHCFLLEHWVGEPIETEEMLQPTWFDIGNLPLDRMMPIDSTWLPIALEKQHVIVRATYGPFQKELIGEVEIEEVVDFLQIDK